MILRKFKMSKPVRELFNIIHTGGSKLLHLLYISYGKVVFANLVSAVDVITSESRVTSYKAPFLAHSCFSYINDLPVCLIDKLVLGCLPVMRINLTPAGISLQLEKL
jgi:hypothetical protein